MGSVNNPACWSFIPYQVELEGQLTYTVTFYELQKAVLSLLKANTAKDCPFLPASRTSSGAPMCRDIGSLRLGYSVQVNWKSNGTV